MTMIPFTGDSQALSLLWRIWSAYTHTQKIMQIKNPSHYANKNYSTTHKFMLVFMTVTHHRKPNFHQIEEKKNKPHHFWRRSHSYTYIPPQPTCKHSSKGCLPQHDFHQSCNQTWGSEDHDMLSITPVWSKSNSQACRRAALNLFKDYLQCHGFSYFLAMIFILKL